MLGRFISPDTIVPDLNNPQSWDRYSYANNNPIRYNDPTGHFAWLPVLIGAGALIGAGINYVNQVSNNYQNNGYDLGAALTTNIDVASIGESAVTGAGIGLTAGVLGPAALAVAGDTLTGAGLLTGSTTIFGAGIAATEASINLNAKLLGTPVAINNPLSGIKYSDKIKNQMNWPDYHGFPREVDAFGSDGVAYQKVGGDGISYTHVEIQGNYRGKEGVFHYIMDPDRICYHRLFEPPELDKEP